LVHLLVATRSILIPLIGGWWMTEVRSKEIASGFEVFVISFDNLSFSYFAFINTGSFSISTQTFHNDIDIISHDFWGTECGFWDQISSIVEDAWSWALGSFCSL
jgi:hypothetical protein